MRRRDLLLVAAAAAGGGVALPAWRWGVAEAFEVTKTDEEWRRLLTPAQYQVLRHEATERPGSSALLREHRKGVFVCAGCELPLFKSETKFESGTGWPSFWSPDRRHRGRQIRLEFGDGANRSALPALRRPSRPRLQRRPAADRPALLHERRRLEIHTGRELTLRPHRSERPRSLRNSGPASEGRSRGRPCDQPRVANENAPMPALIMNTTKCHHCGAA